MLTTLPTIAEIAIVITGFVGLVVALRPSMLADQGANGIRLRLHILQTLTLVFLCLLPGFIQEFNLESRFEPWPIANAVMALVFAITLAWRTRIQITSSDESDSGLPLLLASALYIVVIAFCFLNALGVIESYGAPIYFAGILTNLATSCATFVLLLFGVRDNADDEA